MSGEICNVRLFAHIEKNIRTLSPAGVNIYANNAEGLWA